MMNSLKQQIIDYRNNHKESRVLLGVLLGEFERLEKSHKHISCCCKGTEKTAQGFKWEYKHG